MKWYKNLSGRNQGLLLIVFGLVFIVIAMKIEKFVEKNFAGEVDSMKEVEVSDFAKDLVKLNNAQLNELFKDKDFAQKVVESCDEQANSFEMNRDVIQVCQKAKNSLFFTTHKERPSTFSSRGGSN
jgi:hypothetical protein